MPLQLHCQSQDSLPAEVFNLTPDRLRDQSLADIQQRKILHGNRKVPFAELFHISGDPSDGVLEFSGDLHSVHGIGAGMTSGLVRVVGNAGRHLGSEMRGGEIHVTGNVGDWLGAEMRGGLIRVHGNAGNLAGAAYRGSVRGMTGGTILVAGNVGDEAGHSLRRGLLAVAGDCGDFAGVNMLAGSLLIFGRCGRHPGAGMRRGTIAILGPHCPALLPTFRPGCRYEPVFMQLLLRDLERQGFSVPAELSRASYRIYHGDEVSLGRGEILAVEAARRS
jgi:formylmethanofuran dehydrogenase subunit C